ncbi:MAG: substrate-binding periplasmic protein [Vogesella sp.]|uniref:substrate-binding periplasmic protein n=1 Tax=Vogesella sp. TaxID=1904252 RepID=UPI003F30FE98
MRVSSCLAGGLLLSSITWVQAAPVLTVCAEPWPPFIDSGNGKPAEGLVPEVLGRVATAQPVRLKYVFKAAAACLRLARQGQVDVLAFASAADSPPGWVQTRQPLVFWVLSAWVPAHSPLQSFDGLDMFRGQRVGWVAAYDYPAVLKAHTDWRRVDVLDTQRGIQMLAGGRVDVVFDDALAAEGVAEHFRQKVKRLSPLLASVSQPLSLRPGLEPLRDGVDVEAALLRKHGQLAYFYQQHFGTSLPQVVPAAQ